MEKLFISKGEYCILVEDKIIPIEFDIFMRQI